MATTKPQKAPALTPDEIKAVQGAALAVWQYVGADYVARTAEAKEASIDNVGVPRDEVIEVVADADRLTDQIKTHGKAVQFYREHVASIDYDALAKKVAALDAEQVKAILKPAFPFREYGL